MKVSVRAVVSWPAKKAVIDSSRSSASDIGSPVSSSFAVIRRESRSSGHDDGSEPRRSSMSPVIERRTIVRAARYRRLAPVGTQIGSAVPVSRPLT